MKQFTALFMTKCERINFVLRHFSIITQSILVLTLIFCDMSLISFEISLLLLHTLSVLASISVLS